jgi:NADH dehydrogenase
MGNEPQVVILGCGFAGQGAALKLKNAPVKITIVDQNDYHTFQPLLYQLATDEMGVTEVGFPIREIMHRQDNAVFHQVKVTGIDLANKRIQVEGMDPIGYDYLIVGLGAVVNFFGTKGAQEHAFPLYTLRDALRLKDHILKTLEATDKNPALIDDGALTFCVVGGGPTGVETSGALAELMHAVAEKDYPNLPIKDKAQIILFEMGPQLLGPFKPKLQNYAKKRWKNLGMKVGRGVAEIDPTASPNQARCQDTHGVGRRIQLYPLAHSWASSRSRAASRQSRRPPDHRGFCHRRHRRDHRLQDE